MSYLVYDADCGFCTSSAKWLNARGADVTPWQSIGNLTSLGLTEQMVSDAAYWVAGDGEFAAGAEAIAHALEETGGWRRPLGRVVRSRLVGPLARRVYAWVAVNRYRFPGSTDSCRLPRQT